MTRLGFAVWLFSVPERRETRTIREPRMAKDGSSWNAIMQYSFLRVFANDGLIDPAELGMLQKLALEDGKVDDRERAVLSGIFARVDLATVDPSVRDEILRFKAEYGIE
jgi:hypothetical protein